MEYFLALLVPRFYVNRYFVPEVRKKWQIRRVYTFEQVNWLALQAPFVLLVQASLLFLLTFIPLNLTNPIHLVLLVLIHIYAYINMATVLFAVIIKKFKLKS